MTTALVVLRLALQAASAIQLGLGAPVSPAQDSTRRLVTPVLAFPEAGLDDPAAYQGYQTRFYRDSKENAVQIYLDPRGGRVLLLWADGANESVGFTARDALGRPARLTWSGVTAAVADSGAIRTIEYRLTTNARRIQIGWFLLGSMRVERDFQYARRHLRPFTSPPFYVTEESLLVANVARLPAEARDRHLALLGADSLAALRARLQPAIAPLSGDTNWALRIERPSLDGRNHLSLELRGDTSETSVAVVGRVVSIRARTPAAIQLTLRVATDGAPLTPLDRDKIFNDAFREFLAGAHAAHDTAMLSTGSTLQGSDSAVVARYRRLEREVRSVELLSSEEKLMAGLPNFATYFGRDMLMTALMMRTIWSTAMSEHVIASVLRKLGPSGEVSHEEAIGGQAIRENAAEYNDLLADYFRAMRLGKSAAADSNLALAGTLLRNLQATRENYHMLDDEFQLPVLEARYLGDSQLSVARRRAFLLGSEGGSSRLRLMLREMALVATETRPYVDDAQPMNLVSFVSRDPSHWRSASWRDSDAGYANGRFAMDINAIWAPRALESIAAILATLPALGFRSTTLDSIAPEVAGTELMEYARDSAALRRAIDTWRGARRHFLVTVSPQEIAQRTRAKLAWLPPAERSYWQKVMTARGAARDPLVFLALSLDASGRPIPVVNTDPSTDLFLDRYTPGLEGGMKPEAVLQDVSPFMRAYPAGLLVDGLGPVVANDTYAPLRVWELFRRDTYHSPKVVWGREVNLLFLGLANQIAGAFDSAGQLRDPGLAQYVRTLDGALRRSVEAVNASGLEHNELWSYRIEGGRLLPTRYGAGSDVQLWSTTDLAVQFVLSTLPGQQ
jgi:hypothetical protein